MQDDSGPSADGGSATPTRISCIECRRLKRKCDRIHPCNQCRRYDKTCVFPSAEVPRRGKKYLAEVKERMEHLERLLAEHAPHVVLETKPVTSPGPSDGHVPSGADSGSVLGGPVISGPSYMSPGGSMIPAKMSHERTPPTSSFFPSGARSPVGRSGTPVPPSGASASGVSGPSNSARPSAVGSPTSPLRLFSEPNPSVPSAPPPRLRHPSFPVSSSSVMSVPPSSADAYERQPRNASGYEWNERQGTVRENDGTASLSVEPDGEGYLGFASGATLLRILQMTAGGISLSHIPSGGNEPPAPDNWIPSHGQLMTFIDSYFQHYHTQYPIIHEPSFRAQLAEVIPQPPRKQWEVLVNVVVGLGAFCCSQPMYVIDYFLERAISVITVDHLETGSLVLVQAFTLLSNLSQKRNKPNAGSTYLGIAVRMAIGLGLHRELPLWNIKPFEREVRRRVWWVVFIFDSGASITFGRPILLPYGEADVKMVHNVQDRDFTPSSPVVPPASSDTTIYSSLIYQASFHLVSNRCYGRVISAPPPSAEEVLELDEDLRHWHASIPEWMTSAARPDMFPDMPWLFFSAHKLFWRYCNLRIILARRAFLERALKRAPLSTAMTPDAELEHTLASICLQCAIDTIYDIHEFFKAHKLNRLETWYGLHFIFQASFVPLIALHTDLASPDHSAWREAVRLARETLLAVKGDPLADKCLRIMDLLTPGVPDTQTEANALLDFFSTHPMWQGSGADMAQDLLPFADLATLVSLWPAVNP